MHYWNTITLSIVTIMALTACGGGGTNPIDNTTRVVTDINLSKEWNLTTPNENNTTETEEETIIIANTDTNLSNEWNLTIPNENNSTDTNTSNEWNLTTPNENNTTETEEDNITIPNTDTNLSNEWNLTIPNENNTTEREEDNITIPITDTNLSNEWNLTIPSENNTTETEEENITIPITDTLLSCEMLRGIVSTDSIKINIKCSDTDGITEASMKIKDDDGSIEIITLDDNSTSIDSNITFLGLEDNSTYTLEANISSLNAQLDEFESQVFEANITTEAIIILETPPIIELENQTLENKELLEYILPITQTDGDIVSIVVSGLPKGFLYYDFEKMIKGKSSIAWTTTVTVEATDNDGTTTKTFDITVKAPITLPTITFGADKEVTDSEVVVNGADTTIDVTYTNIQAGAVFSISGHLDFSIDTNGVISYTGDSVSSTATEVVTLTISVQNPLESKVSESVNITIKNNG